MVLRLQVSADDLPQDVGQGDVLDGDEILADVLVYGGHGRRPMLRVVVAEAESAGCILIVIGESFDAVVAESARILERATRIGRRR